MADSAETTVPTGTPPAPRSRARWWVLGLVVAGAVLLVWLAWSAYALLTTQQQATAARAALASGQASLADGDVTAARADIDQAATSLQAADDAVRALPLKVLARVPWVGQTVHDLRYLVAGAQRTAAGATALVDVATRIDPGAGGTTPLFADGAVDLTQLDDITAAVAQARDEFDIAVASFDEIQGSGPGGGIVTEARDEALAEAVPLRDSLTKADAVLPLLPAALGADGPKRYLVALLSSAEVHASGGTVKAVIEVTSDDGRIGVDSIESTGQASLAISGPEVGYEHRSVFYEPQQPVRFAWATLDPDYRFTGYELATSYEAVTGTPVDGVVAIDNVGLVEPLRVTGPLDAGGLGTITADNFLQYVLVDSYREFGDDDAGRKALNAALLERTVAGLQSGDTALPLLRALGAGIPGRHVQAWAADPALEDALVAAGLGGQVVGGATGDHIAVFTQNWNDTKNDPFQRRVIDQSVTLAADGSATVRRTTAITWDLPDDADSTDYVTCLRGCWSYAYLLSYVPAAATDVQQTIESTSPQPRPRDLPNDPPRWRWDIGPMLVADSVGRPVAIAGIWVAPDGTATQTLTYSLPPGTFAQPDSTVRYDVTADPQPFAGTSDLTVTVQPPAGWLIADGSEPTLSTPLDRVVTWSTVATQ